MSDKHIIPPHGFLRRRGLPTITAPMRAVLIQLREAGDSFVALPKVDSRTVRALEERDWIVASPPQLNTVYYRITGRGLHALKAYEPLIKRSDGICCRCGVRERFTYTTGQLAPYCKECSSKIGSRENKLKIGQLRPDGICSRCHKRPRFVASTGRVYCYCQRCKNLVHRQKHKRQRRELYIRIIAGEHVPCPRAGCSRPRLVTGESVQELCREHYYEYQRKRNRRRGKNVD